MTRFLALSGLFLSLVLLVTPAAFADADLQTVVISPPAGSVIPLPAGGGSMIGVTLFNGGPDVARNVVVRFELPPGVTIPYENDSRCDFSASPIVCRAGDVPTDYRDGAPHFELPLRFPLSNGTHTVVATAISAETPDPKPENNRITATYTTTIVVDLSVNSEPAVIRADPGQTVPVRVSVNNFLPDINPHDVRIRFEAENGSIETITAPEGFTCTGSGPAAECVASSLGEGCACSGFFSVMVRAAADRNGGTARLRTIATSSITDYLEQNNQSTTTIVSRRMIAVTNTADAGAGSFRAAIDEANRCGLTPCKIAFEIPGPVPAEGWFTIAPSSPLPAILGDRVYVDGATQTALTGDTNPLGPEVALDGRFTAAGHGLMLRNRCESVVDSIVIGNFRDHAIDAGGDSICPEFSQIELRRIAHNYLGTDPTGNAAWPNFRGILVQGTAGQYEIAGNAISGNVRSGMWVDRGAVRINQNRIGTTADGTRALPNGASGIYVSPRVGFAEIIENIIGFNRGMGVAIERGADQIEVRQNSMRSNGGLGIDWELDGVSPQRNDEGLEPSNAPVILSARYDENTDRTFLTMTLKTGKMNGSIFGAAAVIDLYANPGPDGDGTRWLGGGTNYSPNVNGEPFTIEIMGDFRGQWLNATSTRLYFIASRPPRGQSTNSLAGGITRTSELSNAVQVP
jgi:hypothetical protein